MKILWMFQFYEDAEQHLPYVVAWTAIFGNFIVIQARNQLWTPGGAKRFLRGAHIFRTISNTFKLRPTHFSRGGRKIF